MAHWIPETWVDQFRYFTALSTVSIVGRGLLEFAVDPQLNPADGQQPDVCFGLAGLDCVAGPELPLPNARR
jgi:hypothetical protein